MYAIIATGGKQLKVTEGDVVKVERLTAAVGDTVTFDEVLVLGGDEIKIGSPYVQGASVTATVLEEGRERKVIVYRYKRKSGYHKKNGHRQIFTRLKIETVNA
jgi:large subunit ribosomal protein L21